MPDRRSAASTDELAHAERLGEVVVRPDPQAVHLVVLGAAGADHDDRDRGALRPQRLRDPPPVLAGEHEIDHRDVRALEPQLAQCRVAVVGPLDVHARPAQMGGHGVRDDAVVLRDEHPWHTGAKGSRGGGCKNADWRTSEAPSGS
jgi:hypothetical protein